MLVNSLGQQFGLLSGGCLEGNLLPFIRQAWQKNKSILKTFDFDDSCASQRQ
ncbi:XdhC family protein [Glaciecola petra]|uniref:XdhC family protein n=1 Tax=Glaciecola petra TaxID=3075602 RepID=A0ABU2ZPT0_9ALTE|nr:XdhC family protein [Aestuariibacter sp. P117]MDT0594629.1 XdhC family protein [Aestuariibacter sp. P117]